MVNNYFNNFYKGKKVFLTGHTGFKGAWMMAWLHSMGAIIKGYALAPDSNPTALYNIIDGNKICDSVIADIRDCKKLMLEIQSFQPDIIFHLAAQPLVRYSYQNPIETFEVNTIGTANVLEAVRCIEKKCAVIIITTDKVYQNNEWLYPYRETDRLGGYDPYSASKAAAEIIVDSYRNSFFNINQYEIHKKAIATARAGNVIGGGDWSTDRIIPDIIRSLSANSAVQVRNPGSVRPWQHVLEPIGGYLMLAEKLYNNSEQFTGAWNFGPHNMDNLSVKNLVENAIKIWGTGTYETPELSGQPHEASLLTLDINKAINALAWSPKLNAIQAIEKTIDWYKQAAVNPKDVLAFTLNQIKEYTNT